MAPPSLPAELWELICSHLPKEEVLRLISLNPTFLSCGLSIRYGTFSIRPSPNLKALLRPLMSPDISGRIHTLQISNSADRVSSRFLTVMLPLGVRTRLRKWKRQHIIDSIRHLRGISCLIFDYYQTEGLSYPYSYVDYAWKQFSHSLVVLDLRLRTSGLHHFSCLDPSLVCPHIRTLKLGVSLSSRTNAVPILASEQALFDSAIQRLSTLLASSPLAELIFTESMLNVKRAAPLSAFKSLTRIVCYNSGSFPFDLVPLLHENLETLQDISLHQIPENSSRPLDWSQATLIGQNLRIFSLQTKMFHAYQDIILSQLANCHRLESFELIEPLGRWGIDFPMEVYHQMFKGLFRTLSMHCPGLTRLSLPFCRLHIHFFFLVVAELPNLPYLIIRGGKSVIMDPSTANFLGRFPNSVDPASPWVELIFENIGAAVDSTIDGEDIFDSIVGCGTLVCSPDWSFYSYIFNE